MCTHNISSEQTPLCPGTILLEYKLILISGEQLTSGGIKADRQVLSRWKPSLNRTWVKWTAGILWAGHSRIHLVNLTMGGAQLNGITVHNTYSTPKSIGEGWVSPGFSIYRALRSDCLFLSKLTGGWGHRKRRGKGGNCEQRCHMAL